MNHEEGETVMLFVKFSVSKRKLNSLMFFRCSFMQLDLGHLRITNEFSWHGDPEKDPSAVHLDILDAEVTASCYFF